jgi:hypothetical protein
LGLSPRTALVHPRTGQVAETTPEVRMKLMALRFAVLASVIPAIFLSCNNDTTTQTTTTPPTGSIALLMAIKITPGNPILSSTKSWVDDATKRLYLTDVSNAGVDVIDTRTHAYVGRVTGFTGSVGAAATSGPNSITFSGDGKAWVSDGVSVVKVVDLTSLTVTATISTSISACDNGTVHNCQRTNEISYDPEHKIIFVQNPTPLDLTGTAIDTYGTFISSVAPYPVLGTITFTDRRGQEAPLYDPDQHRFLTAVSGRLVGTTVFDQYIAVIDPTVRPFVVEKKFTIDCFALGLAATPGAVFGINDPALGANEKMVIPGCGKALIMDAKTGAITPVTQIGGGNETWFNKGDNRYYVTGADVTTGLNSLGVIDATTGTWLQSVPAVQATNPTASAVTNEIYAVVQTTAAQVLAPTTDVSACSFFGPALRGTGCVLLFAHVLPTAPRINAIPHVMPINGGVVDDDD